MKWNFDAFVTIWAYLNKVKKLFILFYDSSHAYTHLM